MSENTNTATKQTWLDKALTVVENVCNKLPDPVILVVVKLFCNTCG